MKKIFILALLMMFVALPFASAFDFDNAKKFDKDKPIKGQIDIINSFGFGDKIATYIMTSWSDYCLIDCYGEWDVKLYGDGKIFSDLKFEDRKGLNKEKQFNLFINGTEEYQEPITNQNCSIHTNINGSQSEVCNPFISGYETKTRKVMKPYNFETVDAGNYKIRLEGKKTTLESLDVLPSAYGIEMSEWAWWNSGWGRKQQININVTFANLNETSTLINITYDSDMLANFSDLRFVDSSETTELGYWFYNNSYVSGNAVEVWVKTDHLNSTSNKTIYMYYNNSAVTTTSNISNAFMFGDDFGTLDFTNKWQSSNQALYTVSGGTMTGAGTATAGQKIETLRKFNGGYVTEWRSNTANITDGLYILSTEPTAGTFTGSVVTGTILNAFRSTIGGETTGGTPVASVYYRWKTIIPTSGSGSVNITSDTGTELKNKSGTPNAYVGYVGLLRFVAGTTSQTDWTYVRRYTPSVPTYTFGAEQDNLPSLTPTQSYPVNVFNTTNNTVAISCNFTSYLQNISSVNITVTNSSGTKSFTNTTTVGAGLASYNATWFTSALADDSYNWSCGGFGNAGANATSANRTFTVDTTAPTVTILFPTNNKIVNSPSNTSLNYSYSDAGVGIQSCKYNLDNGANVSLVGCLNTSFATTIGDHLVNLFVNDTLGTTTQARANFSVVNLSLSQAFNQSAIETSAQTFTNIINHSSNVTINSASIVYNVTVYSGATNTSFTYNRSLNIPFQSFNQSSNSFYWSYNLSFNGLSQIVNSSANSQTVYKMVIDTCGTITNLTSLNYTTYYESNRSVMNGTNLRSTMFIWLTENYNTASLRSNASFALLNDADGTFPLCIYPTFANYKVDSYSTYDASGYATRIHIFSGASINNVSQDIALYLVESTNSSTMVAKTVNGDLVPLANIIVKMQRYYPELNSYIEVENGRTDDLGQAVLHIQEQQATYKFLFYNSSNSLLTTTNPTQVVCYSTPCVVTFVMNSTSTNLFKNYQQTGLSYYLTFDNATNNVTFTFADANSLTQNIRLLVSQFNVTGVTSVCNQNISASSGSMQCHVTNNGTYFAQAFYTASPENVLDRLSFSIDTSGIAKFGLEGLFWSFLFLLQIACVGYYNPSVGVGMTALGLIVVMSFGFIALSWLSIVSVVLLAVIAISQLKT